MSPLSFHQRLFKEMPEALELPEMSFTSLLSDTTHTFLQPFGFKNLVEHESGDLGSNTRLVIN